MVKKKLITKKMLERAENAHFRSETYPSLVKSHALSAMYYKRKKKMKIAKVYLTSPSVGKKIKQLTKKYY